MKFIYAGNPFFLSCRCFLHMPLGSAITITFCQLLLTDAREVIVVQLKLLGLTILEESGIVQMDAMVRADLIDLMARILMEVFQAAVGNVDDRVGIQSQNQAGALGAQGHRLLTAVEREAGSAESGEPASSV
jgi:hypothetical protein